MDLSVASPHTTRLVDTLARVSYLTFALYLVLLLGANSVAAAGGPLAWLPLWRLPAAGGVWEPVGVATLLPIVSLATWLIHRHHTAGLRSLRWGWGRVTLPLALLAALALLSLTWPCLAGACEPARFLRLFLLAGHVLWIYLYVHNEQPDLVWPLAGIIVLQAGVAAGQFLAQRDLGLPLLGEPSLDPAVKGVSVVMRGSTRWLRGYGLTNHPNTTAGTLVTALMILPLFAGSTQQRRTAVGLLFVIGSVGVLATLARWAIACLMLGVVIHAAAWLRAAAGGWRPSRRTVMAGVTLLLPAVLVFAVYGDALLGRAVATDTAVENRSLWERERDIALAWRLMGERPLTGVGLGSFVAAAREYDAWASTVHNVPLLLGAELGAVAVALWLWWVIAPVWRRGALARHAPVTALWLSFCLLGLFYPAPQPFLELRGALLTGLVVGLVAQSGPARSDLPES